VALIKLENVCLDYPVYGSKSKHLRFQLLRPFVGSAIDAAGSTVYVHALKNINLQLNDGDRVGLTGHNGSGKSTLLRTLAGVYAPTAGKLQVEGSRLQIFNIDHGIAEDATGLENIFLKAFSLGFTRRQITERLNDIIEFSELGDYIQLPVSSYSQGMRLRLSFSVITSFEPEILLIDEVIGVGDNEFQEKAQARLQSLIDRTQIVMIASHDEIILESLCNRRISLRSGELES